VSHATARLTVFGRKLIVQRVKSGWTVAAAAESTGVSAATAYKWLRRFDAEGVAGLETRSSRPHRSPRRMPQRLEDQIVRLRRKHKLGPHQIAGELGIAQSSCYAALKRRQLNRLSWLDRPTGQTIRRYERQSPGDLGHLDVKKLARIPPGGGHKKLGRLEGPRHTGGGYEFVHTLIDDHSRVAYSEVLPNEKAETCAGFLYRAAAFFEDHGVRFRQLMTDNAKVYRYSFAFRAATHDLGIEQIFTRSRHPETNGKVERFNRTLLEEWAYVRLYRSNSARNRLLPGWLHRYNHHRSHTALKGRPPMARLNNLCGNYS
jgi:transposase InsO family protein